jgi:hypothetical protein
MSENNFSADGSPPVEIDGFQLEKEHFDLICDLARDQCRDPYEYLESLLKWMREQGYGPRE